MCKMHNDELDRIVEAEEGEAELINTQTQLTKTDLRGRTEKYTSMNVNDPCRTEGFK